MPDSTDNPRPLAHAKSILSEALVESRRRWVRLAGADVLFKLVSAITLGPLFAVALRLAVALSGEQVLTDLDLLFFARSPLGWASLLLLGALAVGIYGLQLAVLLSILATREAPSVVAAVRFALAQAWPVLRLAVRIGVEALLWLAPIGLVVAAAYFTLLGEYDINFYLDKRPPEFLAALGIAAVALVAAVSIVVRLFWRWCFALPMVLFEGYALTGVGGESERRMRGHRLVSLIAIGATAAISFALGSLATALPAGLLDLLVGPGVTRLGYLAAAGGLCVGLAVVGGLAANLVGNVLTAATMDRLYRRLGGGEAKPAAPPAATERPPLVTRKRLAAATLIALLAAVTIGFVVLADLPLRDFSTLKVIGHRGAPTVAPENTLASIDAAIEAGADRIEVDVQEIADGTVVVFHDSDFMKAAGSPLKIWDATPEDLAELDVGSRLSEEFAGERVPTLDAFLKACRGRIPILIELKYYGHDERLEQRVVEIVEQNEMIGEAEYMSLNRQGVGKMKGLRPEWRVGLVMSVAVGNVSSAAGDFVGLNASSASFQRIQKIRRTGRGVYVWTVDDPLLVSSLAVRGVDGLITNRPDMARAALAELAEMSLAERLLVELAARF